jgi:uncharacterized protein (TIGR02300 family)
MSTKQARGTKRTCQSAECGSRFYDLNRDPITCPICGTIYELAHSPVGAALAEEKSPRKARKVDAAPKVAPVDGDAEVDADDALAEIETEDGDEIAAEADETFLEEEEEGGDVTGIISGVEGDEER